MNHFSFVPLDIPGACLIASFISLDNRGSFVKNFEAQVFQDNGMAFRCSETFITHSRKNVIRGMHFQTVRPQAKLIGVISGRVFDVIIDLRIDSPTFGQWRGYSLSENNTCGLYIPRGCAHGFLSQSDDSILSYNCDGTYDKDSDTGIVFSDADIGIAWPIDDISMVICSEKDRGLMDFKTFCAQYTFTMQDLEKN